MTSLDELDLPTAMIQAIKDAGLKSVEELCAKRMIEVAKMVDRVAENGIQGIKDVRAALGKLGPNSTILSGGPCFPRIGFSGISSIPLI